MTPPPNISEFTVEQMVSAKNYIRDIIRRRTDDYRASDDAFSRLAIGVEIQEWKKFIRRIDNEIAQRL